MEKNYNVKEFVDKYVRRIDDSDRAKFIKTNLKVDTYMPYAEKVACAERIVKTTSYAIIKDENSGEMKKTNRIKINSPMRYILFVMNIVNEYTNISVNFANIMPEFDALNKNGLIEVITDKIGEREMAEFNTVVDMILNDFMTNEYEFKNFVSEQLSNIGELVQKITPIIGNITNKLDNLSEEDMNKLEKWLERFGKFIK